MRSMEFSISPFPTQAVPKLRFNNFRTFHPFGSLGLLLPYNPFASHLQFSDNPHGASCQPLHMDKSFFSCSSWLKSLLLVGLCALTSFSYAQTNQIPNRLVDYDTFLVNAQEIGRLRTQRKLTEDKFIEFSESPSTVIFDARSDDKYKRLHIKGARHLSFTEITAPELVKVLPDKSSRILIYCNNNFLNSPIAFASKAPSASLNIHTFNTLYSYGYTNVYELGPLIDIRKSRLQFEGTDAASR